MSGTRREVLYVVTDHCYSPLPSPPESHELSGCGAHGKSEMVPLLLPFCMLSYPISSPWVKWAPKEYTSSGTPTVIKLHLAYLNTFRTLPKGI